jgi:hypothetical protein
LELLAVFVFFADHTALAAGQTEVAATIIVFGAVFTKGLGAAAFETTRFQCPVGIRWHTRIPVETIFFVCTLETTFGQLTNLQF